MSTVGRIVTGLVLVELAREDVVAASKAFNAWGGYCDGDQSSALNTLIQAFNDEDGDLARQGVNSGAVKNLDVEFTRMVKDIKLPEAGGGLEAAAAELGAKKIAAAVARNSVGTAAAAAAAPPPSRVEHSFGVDPVSPDEMGATREQREEEVRQQLEDEDDDDEGGLC